MMLCHRRGLAVLFFLLTRQKQRRASFQIQDGGDGGFQKIVWGRRCCFIACMETGMHTQT